MSRSVWQAGVVAATLGLGGLALAQATGGPGSPAPEEKRTYEKKTDIPQQNLRTFTLTVKDVDEGQHRVQFEAQVSPEANILESGQPIKLDQLEAGDQVRASFDPSTGTVVKLEVIKAPRPGSESGSSGGK